MQNETKYVCPNHFSCSSKKNHALLAWDYALKDLHNDLTYKWNLSHIHKPIESEFHEIFELIHKLTHLKKLQETYMCINFK